MTNHCPNCGAKTDYPRKPERCPYCHPDTRAALMAALNTADSVGSQSTSPAALNHGARQA